MPIWRPLLQQRRRSGGASTSSKEPPLVPFTGEALLPRRGRGAYCTLRERAVRLAPFSIHLHLMPRTSENRQQGPRMRTCAAARPCHVPLSARPAGLARARRSASTSRTRARGRKRRRVGIPGDVASLCEDIHGVPPRDHSIHFQKQVAGTPAFCNGAYAECILWSRSNDRLDQRPPRGNSAFCNGAYAECILLSRSNGARPATSPRQLRVL